MKTRKEARSDNHYRFIRYCFFTGCICDACSACDMREWGEGRPADGEQLYAEPAAESAGELQRGQAVERGNRTGAKG